MKTSSMLFLGDLWPAGRSYQRFNVLKDILGKVDEIHTSHPSREWSPTRAGYLQRILNKIGIPIDQYQINDRILQRLATYNYDLIWVEKVNELKPQTLAKMRLMNPQAKIIFFSEDDMFNKRNASHYFRKGIQYYDIVFTTKSYNCNHEELPAQGAKKVIFVQKGFDEILHRPYEIGGEIDSSGMRETPVGFIGTYAKERAMFMLGLAQAGIKIKIWGPDWGRFKLGHPSLYVMKKPLFGKDYVREICMTKINLCFLRKENRDLQTDRSIEIPACGAFMLAERTSEHLALFKEGIEADYFDPKCIDSCKDKICHYLSHEEDRKTIAKNGRRRCLESGYSHRNRIEEMLNHIKMI